MSETANLKIVAPDANSVLVPLHSHFATLASTVDKAVTDRFQVKQLRYETTAQRDEEYSSTTGEPVDASSGKPSLVDGDMCLVIANKREYVWDVTGATKGWLLKSKRFVVQSISERALILGEDLYEGDSCYVTDLDRTYNYDGANWVTTDGLVQVIPTASQVVVTGSGASGTVDDYGNINFTVATSISLNGVFTSRFKHYKLMLTTDSSATDYINFQLVTGTTPNTGSTYFYGGFNCSSSAIAFNSGSAASTFGRLGNATTGSSFANSMSAEVLNPQVAAYTRINSTGMYNNVGTQYNSAFNAATVFDGIKIIPQTGTTTLTGTVKIYGYN